MTPDREDRLPHCPMCGNGLYLNVLTGDWTCARCCPPQPGDVIVNPVVIEPEEPL